MPDYMFLLESRLSPEQRDLFARVQEIARTQEVNIYLSGGAVRDLITGLPIRDLDFTVEGNPARIARELEKAGARVLLENEKLRHIELMYRDVDLGLSAARDEVYDRPGGKPEIRFATIMEDLRRRDFSINAIAISLNPASRGLLLDPTNGLGDLEKREVRVLSMHGFTNQPVRLLRILRFCTRLDFKMEPRTAEWFALAIERGMQETADGVAVGEEVRHLAREEKCGAILKSWEARELIGVVHPRLAKRHPDYDGLAKLAKARETMLAARVQPRLFAAATYYLLKRLSPGERAAALRRMEFRSAEADHVQHLEAEALKVVKVLKGRKTAAPKDAYYYLESVPPDLLAFILTAFKQPKAINKIRMYLNKWRPLRLSLPAGELEALGVERGPKFDKILLELFHLQLAGKGRNPQDRVRYLRQLAGIKPEPKKKEKEKEKEKEREKEREKDKERENNKKKDRQAEAAAMVKGRGKKAATPAELEGEAEPADGAPAADKKESAPPQKGAGAKTPGKPAHAKRPAGKRTPPKPPAKAPKRPTSKPVKKTAPRPHKRKR